MTSTFHADTRTSQRTHRLSGEWQVRPIPLHAHSYPHEHSEGEWRTVPECAHLQVAFFPDQPYWGSHLRELNDSVWLYRRTFPTPEGVFHRARLRFDGVDYFASVWLNGHYLGDHEGHFAPFSFDVTGVLRRHGDNELLVAVSSPWDAPNPRGSYPSDHVIRGLVKGQYEHGEGVIPPDVNPLGIWRPTWLLLDDGISIEHIRLETGLDGRVRLRLRVANATSTIWHGQLSLVIAAENHNGPGVEALDRLRLPPGTHTVERDVYIPKPQWWWPWDHGVPNLYRLQATLEGEDETRAERELVFGVRTVRLERSPQRFTYLINERPVFIRGSSYMPALYLSQATEQHLRRDIELARDANLNLLRVHVHVSPPELYDLCDRMGMLVWQDFELNWIQETTADFENRARALQREMIDQLGHHPSVITWACHNEPTMVFTRRHNLEKRPDPALYADACAQDSTRPVFMCSGQMEDDWRRAGDVHSYYGAIWSRRYTDIYRHTFRLNTEFGFEAPAALETLRTYPPVWEALQHLEQQLDDLWAYQAALIQFQVEHLRRLRSTTSGGYIHFWLADLAPQVGCGVLDVHRVPKAGYAALQQASQPLLPMLEHDGRKPRALWILNDTPEGYPRATLHWRIFDAGGHCRLSGYRSIDIRPNEAQWAGDTAWPVAPPACERVELEIRDGDGQTLATNRYSRPFRPLSRPRGYPWKFDPKLGMKVFDKPGAPSLANQSGNAIFRQLPLAWRHELTEWALRQKLPVWLHSVAARLIDGFLN